MWVCWSPGGRDSASSLVVVCRHGMSVQRNLLTISLIKRVCTVNWMPCLFPVDQHPTAELLIIIIIIPSCAEDPDDILMMIRHRCCLGLSFSLRVAVHLDTTHLCHDEWLRRIGCDDTTGQEDTLTRKYEIKIWRTGWSPWGMGIVLW